MKKWFLERFLPMWAKETVFRDNRHLCADNVRLAQENRNLRAYLRGLERGVRMRKGVKNEHV